MADEALRTVAPWPVIRKLGEGGQGTVYLVRSPERQRELDTALHDIVTALQRQSVGVAETDDRLQAARDLVQHLPRALGTTDRMNLEPARSTRFPTGHSQRKPSRDSRRSLGCSKL